MENAPVIENENVENNQIDNQQENNEIEKSNFSDESFANALKELKTPQEYEKTDIQQPEKKEENIVDTFESDELLKQESDLSKYDTFIKAGLSKEEALEKVYGGFRDNYYKEPQTNLQPQPETHTEAEYKLLKAAYANPTDNNLLFHLKNDPELRADFGLYGVDIDRLQTLDIFQDPIANSMFRRTIKDSYRAKIGGFIEEIDKANEIIKQNNEAKANLVSEFEADFLKDFPELNSNDIKTISLAKHFVDRFKQKCSALSENQQTDAELIRKLYKSAKEEYKKIYPSLKKKLGFEQEKQIENVQLQNKKLKEMQENGSMPTGLTNQTSFNLGANSSDDDFAKALKYFTKKE